MLVYKQKTCSSVIQMLGQCVFPDLHCVSVCLYNIYMYCVGVLVLYRSTFCFFGHFLLFIDKLCMCFSIYTCFWGLCQWVYSFFTATSSSVSYASSPSSFLLKMWLACYYYFASTPLLHTHLPTCCLFCVDQYDFN